MRNIEHFNDALCKARLHQLDRSILVVVLDVNSEKTSNGIFSFKSQVMLGELGDGLIDAFVLGTEHQNVIDMSQQNNFL